jgi:large subunit ribosomal protein L15
VKLHQLRPASGARRARTRVGRGIAAGQGKTAGRGTKGQKARAGASIPGWFEGGQTPIHVRVPKLRGFRNPFKVDYQVVNVGRIAEYASAGRFGVEAAAATPASGRKRAGETSDGPVTVNPANLAAAGLVGSPSRPVKVLGHGDVATRLFIVADAFTGSARTKIEAAGGFVQLLNPVVEGPVEATAEGAAEPSAESSTATSAEPLAEATAEATAEAPTEPTGEPVVEPAAAPEAEEAEPAAPAARSRKRSATKVGDES